MRHILFFLLSIGSASIFAEPIPPHVGEWTFTDYASYFKSTGNFVTSNTSSTDLLNGAYFSAIDDTLTVSYDAFPSLRFSANLGYASTTAADNLTSFTGQGLSEGGLGVQYWFRDKRWAIVPTLNGEFPFYRNTYIQTTSLLGNGTVWMEGGIWGLLYYHPVTAYAYIGYRYQDSGLAGWLTNDLGASYRLDTARIRIGVRGETTVTNDNDTINPNDIFLRNNLISNVDRGSLKYYSINPTVWEGYGEFDWLFSRMFEAGLGYAQTFYGSNAAYGWTVDGFIRFRLPTKDGHRPPPENNEPPPASEPIFAPAGTEEQSSPKPRARQQSRQQKNIDQMMQETEKSLENNN
jgi:hypothetical protein